jgi:PAS domain S-box-containing protein
LVAAAPGNTLGAVASREETRAQIPLSRRLRAVLDEVPTLVAILHGADLTIGFVNAQHRRLTGAAEPTGRPLGDVLREVGAPDWLEPARRAMDAGEVTQVFERQARVAGSSDPTWWDVTAIPLRPSPDVPPVGVALHATEVTRLVDARRQAVEAEHRFTSLFDANVTGVTISGESRLLEANDAFLEMVGRTREELAAGLDWPAMTAPDSLDADERALESLRATGAAPPYEKRYLRPDGSEVPVLISGSRLQTDPLLVLATAFDLTERQSVEREMAALLERERDARFEAELAGARWSRLQEITASLSASNSPDAIARAVIHHALEDLSASAGALVRGVVDPQLAHAVGFPPPLVEQWRAFPATLPPPLLEAAREGRTVRHTGTPDADDAPALPATKTVIALPLEVTGRVLGAVVLAFREARELTAEDEQFLELLTRQAAAALDRAQLYENRAYVARKLQEGLLPERVADVPGLETAIVYESISGSGEVGGDFYDLFETGRGSWALAIGDVSGKGTEAAVVTGLARHTIRAVARVEDDPAGMLDFLNGALRRHAGVPAFCTVGCAVIEADADGFVVRLASGGHPFPIIVRADGALEEVEVLGTMLGVTDDPLFDVRTVRLAPQDAMVVYTDGVIDARRSGGERFGEERLFAALQAAAGGTAAHLARAVESAVREHHPGTSADDRAIVVLRAAG